MGTTNAGTLTQRRRHHVLAYRSLGNLDPTLGSATYIDALGGPRGVPNKYQVASGFENIPVLSAFFTATPTKNVDKINYVHYDVNVKACQFDYGCN